MQMVYAKGETLSRSSDDGRGHVDWLAILVGHSGLIKGGARPKRVHPSRATRPRDDPIKTLRRTLDGEEKLSCRERPKMPFSALLPHWGHYLYFIDFVEAIVR